MKNRSVTKPMAVTPALFMADGTECDLPVVNLPASGLATIDVNTVLASAPNHSSEYCSATLRYAGAQSSLIAQTALGSTALSESYMSHFGGIIPGSPAGQTMEGLWWARDAGIGGFIALSNAATQPRNVKIQAVTAGGQTQPAQQFNLASRTTRMVELLSLIGQSLHAGEAGGLRVEFTGLLG